MGWGETKEGKGQMDFPGQRDRSVGFFFFTHVTLVTLVTLAIRLAERERIGGGGGEEVPGTLDWSGDVMFLLGWSQSTMST
jgi:hypothetical protein